MHTQLHTAQLPDVDWDSDDGSTYVYHVDEEEGPDNSDRE